jgi:histidinol-phosphate aminotransferase
MSERGRLTAALRERGFGVADSQANFVFARVPEGDGGPWYQALKERGILVRHFPEPEELAEGLRISVGTAEENDALLAAIDEMAQG